MTNTFRYFTKNEIRRLLTLTVQNPQNIYPKEFDALIEEYEWEMNWNTAKPFIYKPVNEDFETKAAIYLMYDKPGLAMDEILNITLEDVCYDSLDDTCWLLIRDRSNKDGKSKKLEIPYLTYSILKTLWEKYTSVMRYAEGSDLTADSFDGHKNNFYLFSNTKGQRLTLPAWNKRFRKYCEKAGIKLDQGATGVLNYRFHHYYIFSLIFEIEKELDCNIESLSKKEACRILSEKLNGASTTLCYDYVSYFIKNREKVEKDFGKQ